MDEIYTGIISAFVGAICGAIGGGIVSYFISMRIFKKTHEYQNKENVNKILSSIDHEVSNNLKIARENQKNASQGRSTDQRHNFSMFTFTAYDKFSGNITTKLKGQLGENAITHLMNGYNQCRKFNQVFKEYKEGKKPSSRSDLQNFGKIISEFETYQSLR